MTREQKDMLQTLKEHGSVAALNYRLTFEPALQKWAKEGGYVERVRSTYRLTPVGQRALHDTSRERKELSESGKEIPKPTTEAAQSDNASCTFVHESKTCGS